MVRSTSERMERLEKRLDGIRKVRSEKRRRAAIVSGYAACIVIIAAVSAFVGNMDFGIFERTAAAGTASIFANNSFLGYIVVGVLAFLLGIFITLLCDILNRKRKERNNGGADR